MRTSKAVPFDELPRDVQRSVAGNAEKPEAEMRPRSPVTRWSDIPPSWTQHRDCGWAGFMGKCLYCEK